MNFKEFVLFEDGNIIVLNKPAGWLSIPGGYATAEPCLKQVLAEEYGQIWTVHRLDKLTSGVILFAKDENAHRILNEQFSQRLTAKNYRGISHGFPVWIEKTIQIPLRVNGDRHHRTVPDTLGGKPAQTRVILRQHNEHFCRLISSLKRIDAQSASPCACGCHCGRSFVLGAGRFNTKNCYEYPYHMRNGLATRIVEINTPTVETCSSSPEPIF